MYVLSLLYNIIKARNNNNFIIIIELMSHSKTKSAASSSRTTGKGKVNKGTDEQVTSQSAAEFFSEHQQIAGYDNPGKSLFTTIREFIENSLDAAESIKYAILYHKYTMLNYAINILTMICTILTYANTAI